MFDYVSDDSGCVFAAVQWFPQVICVRVSVYEPCEGNGVCSDAANDRRESANGWHGQYTGYAIYAYGTCIN